MLKILLVPILAWFISHILKLVIFAVKNKRWDIKQLVRAGGMPSGHSATVASLSLAVFFEQGLSPLFVVTLVLSIIVARDTMLRLKEVRHKPLEVLIGIILGLLIAFIVYSI
jgi:acid phosphatase family membrane protein YuiD